MPRRQSEERDEREARKRQVGRALAAVAPQDPKAAAREAGVTFSARSVGGMFGLYFRDAPPASYAEVMACDREMFNRFFHAMLSHGVYLAPSAFEAGFVSSAHGAAEIEKTVQAASAVFATLR